MKEKYRRLSEGYYLYHIIDRSDSTAAKVKKCLRNINKHLRGKKNLRRYAYWHNELYRYILLWHKRNGE